MLCDPDQSITLTVTSTPGLITVQYGANVGFTCIFTCEMVLKLASLGNLTRILMSTCTLILTLTRTLPPGPLEYLSNFANVFDGVIVVSTQTLLINSHSKSESEPASFGISSSPKEPQPCQPRPQPYGESCD